MTQEQVKSKTIIVPPIAFYPSIVDTNILLSMLASANNPKPYKQKSYKKTTHQDYGHQKNWQKARQDEINSLTEIKTWSLSSLSSGSRALEGKWVDRIKRGPANKKLRLRLNG